MFVRISGGLAQRSGKHLKGHGRPKEIALDHHTATQDALGRVHTKQKAIRAVKSSSGNCAGRLFYHHWFYGRVASVKPELSTLPERAAMALQNASLRALKVALLWSDPVSALAKIFELIAQLA